MANVPQTVGMVGTCAVLALGIGYFSSAPSYEVIPPDRALIQLSFSHAGQPKGECRRFTAEELAAMAPNMRRPLDCPRERVALVVELTLDGELLFRGALPPLGLAGDGPSSAYERFVVASGPHRLRARLRDTNRAEGYDYEHEAEIELTPRQNFVIDFRADGGFKFL